MTLPCVRGAGRSALTFEPTYSLHSLIPRTPLTEVSHVSRNAAFEVAFELGPTTSGQASRRRGRLLAKKPDRRRHLADAIEALANALRSRCRGRGLRGSCGGRARALSPARPHPNLAIVRTFSKAWRLAGVRLGYMLAAPR